MWYVYIVKCKDESLYTGITTNIGRRIAEHNSLKIGAKYTKTRRPVKLQYLIKKNNKSLASKEECRIKKLSKKDKIELINNSQANLQLLVNIGVRMKERIERIGIKTVGEFLERNPYDVFEEMLTKTDPTLCRCALASVVGAHVGLPWHVITKSTAREFEKRNIGHVWTNC